MNANKMLKLYPYFSSLSGDLLFFIAIDTLFLSTVKGLTAYQIALMTAIGTLICVVLQYPLLRLIKKIGNENSIRIGTFLLLCSACLYTFGNIYLIFVACAFYYLALFFIEMKVNILKNNLDYMQKSQDYMRIDSKSKLLYSIYTLIIILIAAPLFNLNNYIPMYCCIFFALGAFIFSFFIKDKPVIKSDDETINDKKSVKLPKSVVIVVVASILFVPLIIIASTNAKLLTQEILTSVYSLDSVVYFVAGLVLAARIVRVISVLCFSKYCNRLSEKSLLSMSVLLLFSIMIIVFGGAIQGLGGYIFILLGFATLFGLMDPYQLVVKNFILNQTSEYNTQKALSLNYTAISLGQLFLNFIATAILFGLPIIYVFVVFTLFALVEIIIIITLLRNIRKEKLESVS